MSASWLTFLLSRRYVVTSTGDPVPAAASLASATEAGDAAAQDEAQSSDKGPFLILPNNVSLIDPLLIYAHFAALNPLVLLHASQGRGLHMLAGKADIAIFSDDSPQSIFERAAEALAAGRSVLLWPSPHLQGHLDQGITDENVAFSLLHLLQQRGQHLPELFLVRSEGLWGSRFSCYHATDSTPTFFKSLCTHLPALLLGPFLKRRPVRLVTRRHRLSNKSLNATTFKNMLNTWFDAGTDGAMLVPLLPFRRIRRMPLEHRVVSALPKPTTASDLDSPPASPTVPIAPAATADTDMDTAGLSAVAPADSAAQTNPLPLPSKDADTAPPSHTKALHPEATPEPTPQSANAITNETADETSVAKPIINAPLADITPAVPRTPPLLPVQHALTRQGSVTDASYGQHFSRRGLLGLAKAIGTLIGPVPATRIGVALPCGVGAMAAYIAILDCTLENDRIPVLLDPAMSADELTACAQETGISHVLTARQLQGLELPPGTTPMYLEDISPSQIMRGSALSFMGFAGTTEVEAPAAIFCQAGSVFPLSLSHNELMTSLHALIEHLTAPPLNVHNLSILGCLPLHTPLGLLVNTILPLTCGVPIVTVSDPQDATALARSAEDYSVNCFTGSPQSLRNLLRKARSQLAFRYIMLTPDPFPEDLLTLIPKACPHAQVFTADMFGEITMLEVGE